MACGFYCYMFVIAHTSILRAIDVEQLPAHEYLHLQHSVLPLQ